MRITLDPKQLETLEETLNRVINVAGRIAAEMKRANDLKEKELKTRRT